MRNRLFHILEFCFHEACLGLNLRRYACAMNMADSALEMLDVTLFSRGIGEVVVACFVASGSDFVGAAPDEISKIFRFFRDFDRGISLL